MVQLAQAYVEWEELAGVGAIGFTDAAVAQTSVDARKVEADRQLSS